jgi:hypothetical protein
LAIFGQFLGNFLAIESVSKLGFFGFN